MGHIPRDEESPRFGPDRLRLAKTIEWCLGSIPGTEDAQKGRHGSSMCRETEDGACLQEAPLYISRLKSCSSSPNPSESADILELSTPTK